MATRQRTLAEPNTTPGRRLVTVSLVGVYLVLLDWIYVHRISPRWSYLGYTTRDLEPLLFGIVLLFLIGAASTLPLQIARPSQLATWLLFLITVGPMATLFLRMDTLGPNTGLLYALVTTSSFFAIPLIADRSFGRLHLRRSNSNPRPFWLVITLISTLVVAWNVFSNGLNFRIDLLSLDSQLIYETRELQSVSLRQNPIGRVLAYATSSQSNVINPLLIATGIELRKRYMTLVGVAIQFYLFSLGGSKSILFLTLVVAAVSYFLRRTDRGNPRLVGGFVALLASTLLFQPGSVFADLLARRTLTTPGVIGNFYFDFFRGLDPLLLSHSVLSWLLEYPLEENPAPTIGRIYTGGGHANGNFMADGFANFGLLGPAILAVAVGVYLALYDRLAGAKGTHALTTIIVGPAISLTNGGFFTALLSHGLLVALVVAYFYPTSGHADASEEAPAGTTSQNQTRSVHWHAHGAQQSQATGPRL